MFKKLTSSLLNFESQLFFHFKTIEVNINFNYFLLIELLYNFK